MATLELHLAGARLARPRRRIDVRAAAIAWPLWMLAASLTAGALFLILATFSTPMPPRMGFRGWVPLAAMLYATIGARIATRRSRNPVGWLLIAIGLVYGLNALAEEYGAWSYYHEHDWRPGIDAAAWFAAVAPNLTVAFAAFAFLLFPDGKLISRRWRPLASVIAALAILTIAGYALLPNTLNWGVANQLSLPFLRSYPESAIDPLFAVLYRIRAVVLLAPFAVMYWRIRHSSGVVRQQLKWAATAGTFASIAFAINAFVVKNPTTQFILMLGVLVVPIALGIAIRRYRLYEIDVILNRALVWGALSAVLAGLYAASVGMFTNLFTQITDEKSDAALIITTLVVAGAFSPIKSFLQTLVERWFPNPSSTGGGLRAFSSDVETYLLFNDRTRLLSRFLDETVASLGATGGALFLSRRGALTKVHSVGRWADERELSLTLREDGKQICRIDLGPRENGAPYTDEHRELLRSAAELVRQSLVQAA